MFKIVLVLLYPRRCQREPPPITSPLSEPHSTPCLSEQNRRVTWYWPMTLTLHWPSEPAALQVLNWSQDVYIICQARIQFKVFTRYFKYTGRSCKIAAVVHVYARQIALGRRVCTDCTWVGVAFNRGLQMLYPVGEIIIAGACILALTAWKLAYNYYPTSATYLPTTTCFGYISTWLMILRTLNTNFPHIFTPPSLRCSRCDNAAYKTPTWGIFWGFFGTFKPASKSSAAQSQTSAIACWMGGIEAHHPTDLYRWMEHLGTPDPSSRAGAWSSSHVLSPDYRVKQSSRTLS